MTWMPSKALLVESVSTGIGLPPAGRGRKLARPSKDVEDVEQDDDWDWDADQPRENAFHGLLLPGSRPLRAGKREGTAAIPNRRPRSGCSRRRASARSP